MKIVVFGLTVSSSWGNGHATLWRALTAALAARGHRLVFFERDVSCYADHRDLRELPGGSLVLYDSWERVAGRAAAEVRGAEAAIVTSCCPDATSAVPLIADTGGTCVFYDLDTAVTIARLEAGEPVEYLPSDGLRGFDLVLSHAGGRALDVLRDRLGARRVAPLYGFVDPEKSRPARSRPQAPVALSYLGSYAADRHDRFVELFLEPARLRPDLDFVLGGSMYPRPADWPANVRHIEHVWPGDHAAFYASSRFTLHLTRDAMARMGFCPSGRLFEAAACEAAILSDEWEGLDRFFAPGKELLTVRSARDVLDALDDAGDRRRAMGRAARARVLQSHTAMHRAVELERLLTAAPASTADASVWTGNRG